MIVEPEIVETEIVETEIVELSIVEPEIVHWNATGNISIGQATSRRIME